MIEAALYLFPSPLSDAGIERALPPENVALMHEIKHWVVESVRSARRLLKRCDREIDIDALTMVELNEHTPPEAVEPMLEPLARGEAMGVLSDAGCPAVADPGANLVALAQQRGYRVRPLVGPSSIVMGLMASGFNGQSFAFVGYLPVEAATRHRRLRELEQRAVRERQTQIFIETPYRNQRLLDDMLTTLSPQMHLCVACDITGASERIVTHSIAQWREQQASLPKVPTIFLLYQ